MSYKKDKNYFMDADKLTLTGKKHEDDWRNPTLKFGFMNYDPVIKVAFNKEEPITKGDWQHNLLNISLDVNTFHIFCYTALDLLEEGEPKSAFTTQVVGTKKVQGVYVQGENETKGIITFGLGNTGVVFIMIEDIIGRKIRFTFKKPVRAGFSSKGEPLPLAKISNAYARGTLKHWLRLFDHMHLLYMQIKNER